MTGERRGQAAAGVGPAAAPRVGEATHIWISRRFVTSQLLATF